MGIRRDDFEWMLPCEYEECLIVWDKEKYSDIKLQYEIARFNSWLSLGHQVKGKSQMDIFTFPWENEKTGKIKTGKISKWQDRPNTKS